MRASSWLGSTLVLLATCGCKSEPPPAAPTAAPSPRPGAGPSSRPSSQPSSRPTSGAADADVEARVRAATARLEASEAGQIVLAATEAQGGLRAWFEGRALRFRYDYQPLEGVRRTSAQTIDLLSSRAYHTLEHPAEGRLAFDGERAWMKLEGGATFTARFWALTPYYFVGMPFVLADAGVKLELVDEDPAAAGIDAPARVVRATFEAGTGDAPDDYYVLYFAEDDHRLLALRYVVTYAPFFEGKTTKSSPEKLLVYEDEQPAGPLVLARRHTTYAFAEGKRGPKVTVSEVTDVEYGAKFDTSALAMPEGAVIDEGP